MKTTIDNTQRIFYVYSKDVWSNRKTVACNIKDLKKALLYAGEEAIVVDNWNDAFKKLTKKQLAEIMAANGIK